MRIVMLISSFYPLVGGAEKQAQRLSKELVRRGHEVVVLTRMPNNQEVEKIELIDGIKIIRLKVLEKGKLAPLTYLVKAICYIFKNKKQIDILHAHSLSSPGITASLATFLFKIPSISKIAGGGNEIGCEAKRMYVAGGGKKKRILFMHKYLSKYIAISNPIKNDLLEIETPKNKILFIPNGIDMEMKEIKDKEYIRKKLDLPINKKIFLYAGRLELVKGIDILLKAWNSTKSEFKKNSQLVILGQGTFNINKYRNESSITIIGNVDNVSEYMNASDYFLLPSRYEGISNALLEAINHKLLVIASNAGGNTDIINDDTGFLFEKENQSQLTNLLDKTLEYKDQDMKEKVDNAYQVVSNNYDLLKVCDKYEQLYEELI